MARYAFNPIPIRFTVDNTVHRGYRDQSGRFTLEQCNLSKANEAGNLVELAEGTNPEEPLVECEHCYP